MVQGSCDVIHLTSSILLLSCLISSDFLTPRGPVNFFSWEREFRLSNCRCISNAAAKVRRDHCGSRILPQEK